jgi:hypothetical protein
MYSAVLLVVLENLLVGLIKRAQQVYKLLMKVLYALYARYKINA